MFQLSLALTETTILVWITKIFFQILKVFLAILAKNWLKIAEDVIFTKNTNWCKSVPSLTVVVWSQMKGKFKISENISDDELILKEKHF